MEQKHLTRTRVLALAAVLLAVVLVAGLLQSILTPKYRTDLLEGALIGEYYDSTTTHNVLFIGDCEVYESFSTVTLWEEYGISSYIRGSAQQLIWQSYYLLEEAIARGERPEAVVFNVLAMKYGTPQHEEYNRMTLDRMKWSMSKVNAIRASMTEDESFLSYVFPILRYHDRISELSAEDVTALFEEAPTVSYNGYLMQTGVVPMGDKVDPASPYPDDLLPEVSFGYLDRMRELCAEYGIELILIKAPTNNWKYHWYDEWDDEIVAYAEKHDLSYYNFIGEDEEIGLDWTTDTYDAGIHLNVYGAEKLSRYFGEILRDGHGVSDRSGDTALASAWDAITERYYAERNAE